MSVANVETPDGESTTELIHVTKSEPTLYNILWCVFVEVFFPKPDGKYGSYPVMDRVRGSLSHNLPMLRKVSFNARRDVIIWARRGSPLRVLLVLSVGTIALLTFSGLAIFTLSFLAATANAIVISLFVSLAASGGFLAIFFACVATVYIAGLCIAVFVISAITISAVLAALIAIGWIGFFYIVWLATMKSVGLAKYSVALTGSAFSAYISARLARHCPMPDKASD